MTISLFQAAIFCVISCASVAAAPEDQGSGNTQEETIGIGNAEVAEVLGTNASPPEQRVAELFAGQFKDRSGVTLAESGAKAGDVLALLRHRPAHGHEDRPDHDRQRRLQQFSAGLAHHADHRLPRQNPVNTKVPT